MEVITVSPKMVVHSYYCEHSVTSGMSIMVFTTIN
jgi:hypothetical protein